MFYSPSFLGRLILSGVCAGHQANVVGVGVMSAKRESASVMVFMNRTVTDKSRQPLYDGSRLRVDFKKVGNQWLIAYITPI